jgi:hypothetical protein
MNHRASRFALFASTLTALACGPVSVTPTTDGGGPADADSGPIAPGVCAPVALFASDGDSLGDVAYRATESGHIVAAVTRAGAVFVQAFDGQFAPVGARVALRPAEPTPTPRLVQLRIFSDGPRVAVTYNNELYELTTSPSASPTVTRTASTPAEGLDPAIVSAWWPNVPGAPRSSVEVITRDGSSWRLSTDVFTRVASGSDALSWGAVAHSTGDGGFVAFEPIWRRNINNEVRISQRISGHGSLLVVSTRSEVGTAVSPVTRVGDELWRLHAANPESGGPGVQSGLSLVRHDPRTGGTMRWAVLTPSLTLAGSPSGAIAAAPGDTESANALLAWTQRVSDTRSQIVAQWGPSGPVRVVAETDEELLMADAAVDVGAARGWVVYRAIYPRPGASIPAVRAFARCVPR